MLWMICDCVRWLCTQVILPHALCSIILPHFPMEHKHFGPKIICLYYSPASLMLSSQLFVPFKQNTSQPACFQCNQQLLDYPLFVGSFLIDQSVNCLALIGSMQHTC